MRTTSEYCSVGHPDRTCDYISSYILDRYLEQDRYTRYALEVQMKDNSVRLGGEITSKAKFSKALRAQFVREAVANIGYDAKYALKWGAENVPCADDIQVTEVIGEQSPDIAQGVNQDGWGDQGIFWGMAVKSPSTDDMPYDHFIAKRIGQRLYEERIGGIDIKTQVEAEGRSVKSVVVAIPCFSKDYEDVVLDVQCLVRKVVGRNVKNLIVNGTGAYVRHGSIGDCGTTGRKLVVDFYGGNCRIGGGSPWTKDGTKADLALNIYARQKAREAVYKYGLDLCYCGISCCIGRKEIGITIIDRNMNEVSSWIEARPACEIIEELGLREPTFADRCMNGLFG